MGKTYNNLITTTAGFNYAAKQPLDDREVVQKYEDLSTLATSNIFYEGIEVYVVEKQKSYKLVGTDWKAVASEGYVDQKITALIIPTTLANLTDDASHRVVTDAEKTAWNAKSNFSGNYNDLTNKPTIPSIDGLATEEYVKNMVGDIETLLAKI